MSTITHTTLAKIVRSGVARFIYAHPIIQKTSLTISNSKMFATYETGQIVEIRIKQMPTGRRILLRASKSDHTSLESFIAANRTALAWAAKQTGTFDGKIAAEKFDGSDDASYHCLRRFPRHATSTPASTSTDFVKSVGNAMAAAENEEVHEYDDGFKVYSNLIVHNSMLRTLEAIGKVANSVGAANFLLVGSSGNGKTSLARAFAEEREMNFVKINCSVVRDPEEWFGYREARDGSTVFVPTPFTEGVRAGNTVVLLDEINRLEPYLHNSLMPLLDESRETTVHGENIKCGPNTIFVCSMNNGSGFVGTFILDAALRNRMDATIIMQKIPAAREAQLLVERTGIDNDVALDIINRMDLVRDTVTRHQMDIDVSHRSAIKIARLMSTGALQLREVFALVIFNSADSAEQAKLLADSIIE